jgi:hypothetical protein
MKEPRYTITLDNLTMNDFLLVSEAIANHEDGYCRVSQKTRARMAKIEESIWNEYNKWKRANRKCAQHNDD